MKLLPSLMTSVLLYEANVLNGNQEFFGTSIEKYLIGIADSLSTPELQKTFIKKIGRLLLNDERFLHAVREIPDNAPDWAKRAPPGELMYFQPTSELTDTLSNIAHYLDAAALSAKSNDPDTKAFATGEVNGFTKAESIDLLSNKAAAFWKRGSNKVGREVDGLKEVINIGGGFVWYELETNEAFIRAGKALQNCIGTHWSHAKTRAEGAHIFVLRDKNGDTVVAIRTDKNNVIQEIKGKNNKPPVEKYVPAVTSFLQTPSTAGIASSSGQHDLANVGYVIHERTLYTFREAAKNLVKKKPVISNVKTEAGTVDVVLLQDLTNDTNTRNDSGYGNADNNQVIKLVLKFAGIKYIYTMPNADFYGLQRDEKITALAVVEKRRKTIINIADLSTPITVMEADEVPQGKPLADSAVLARILLDSPLATDTDSSVDKYMLQRHQYLSAKHPETNRHSYEPIEMTDDPASSKDVTISQIGKKHARTYVSALIKIASTEFGSSSVTLDVASKAITDSDAVYVIKPRNPQITQSSVLIALDKDNNLAYPLDMNLVKTLPGASAADEVLRYGATATEQQAESDIKTTSKAIIDFANRNNLKLPLVYTAINGIRRNDKTKQYEFFEPEPERLPDGTVRWDLSKMNTTERIATLFHVNNMDPSSGRSRFIQRFVGPATTADIQNRTHFVLKSFDVVPQIYAVINNLRGRPTRSTLTSSWEHRRTAEAAIGVLDHKDDEIWFTPSTSTERGHTPFSQKIDSIYVVPLRHGPETDKKTMNVVALVRDNKVFSVSHQVTTTKWQTWADNSAVASQLTTFAKNNNLRFEKNAFKPYEAIGHLSKTTTEIVVDREGYPTTKEERHASRLERSQQLGRTAESRVSEVPMSDGSKWVKLPAKENANLLRTLFAANTGSVWELEGKDVKALVQGKSIKSIAKGTTTEKVPFEHAPAIAGLGKALGVEVMLMPWVTVLSSPIMRRLREVGRNYLRKKDSSWYKKLDGDLAAPPNLTIDDVLIRKGWATTSRSTVGTSTFMNITAAGREILSKLKTRTRESFLPVKVLAPAEGFVVPEKQARTTPAPAEGGEETRPRVRTPRAPGAESKADMALARYREMTTANNGQQPSRAEFIRILMADPFNMSAAGAATYQYTTKQKYLRSIGQVAEAMSFISFLLDE